MLFRLQRTLTHRSGNCGDSAVQTGYKRDHIRSSVATNAIFTYIRIVFRIPHLSDYLAQYLQSIMAHAHDVSSEVKDLIIAASQVEIDAISLNKIHLEDPEVDAHDIPWHKAWDELLAKAIDEAVCAILPSLPPELIRQRNHIGSEKSYQDPQSNGHPSAEQ